MAGRQGCAGGFVHAVSTWETRGGCMGGSLGALRPLGCLVVIVRQGLAAALNCGAFKVVVVLFHF